MKDIQNQLLNLKAAKPGKPALMSFAVEFQGWPAKEMKRALVPLLSPLRPLTNVGFIDSGKQLKPVVCHRFINWSDVFSIQELGILKTSENILYKLYYILRSRILLLDPFGSFWILRNGNGMLGMLRFDILLPRCFLGSRSNISFKNSATSLSSLDISKLELSRYFWYVRSCSAGLESLVSLSRGNNPVIFSSMNLLHFVEPETSDFSHAIARRKA